MASQVIIRDPNRKPRRAITNAERSELFREFKIGLCALAALALLVVTLCWDRGQGRKPQPEGENRQPNLTVEWRPPQPIMNNNNGSGPVRGEPAPIPPRVDPQPLPPPPPPPPPPPYREYIVQKSDTSLGRVAAKTLGDARKWQLIVEANPGLNPKKMRVGQALRIPRVAAPAPAVSHLAQGPAGSGFALNANGQ